jgi:hypothetical protein
VVGRDGALTPFLELAVLIVACLFGGHILDRSLLVLGAAMGWVRFFPLEMQLAALRHPFPAEKNLTHPLTSYQ